MKKYRTVSFLISFLCLFALALAEDPARKRSKRQAPNINVHQIPKTSFSCSDKKVGEYYADPEANCQVYHVCIPGMHNKMSLISFVCPNGTIFSQATRVCTPYDRVDCSLTFKFYENLHGDPNKRRNYEDADYENFVPQTPPREVPPPSPRQPVRGRNTPAPPPPARETPAPPARNTRFRGGTSHFRGQQAPASTTLAPTRATAAPPQVNRVALSPARPAPPAFRQPVLPVRSPQSGTLANIVPPRPTARAVVSTSTSSYNYEYEYEYDYEDETPEGGSTRTKREIPTFAEAKSFSCDNKVAGGVYADMESECEMFHICVPFGKYKMLDYKVFCANGTGFDQETGSCREKGEFACENSHMFFQLDEPNQPTFGKKPVFKKAKYTKSKKASRINKE